MSFFGDMFAEEGAPGDGIGENTPMILENMPHPPRAASGLCGIYNQGATCYLNSLLQTLMLTPEFREALFLLGSELGKLEDKDRAGAKVRVIPLQLQRLFADLLLLDQQAASTTQLTDSFGWTNSEEMQQHDVQELNRILFSAIEDSLVATTGQNLINKLYHGQIVNQIICQECGRISEREEDFLDICLAVAGNSSLEYALSNSYVAMETMEGSNQYRCEQCQKLVDARKGAKIRRLPPILTISLLRFSFDFVKMERYKETGKLTFPATLDMSAYCENVSTSGDTDYELFSVVIHSGSTHGGHYHAYIRDVDGLGKWTHPDSEEITLASNPQTGKVDMIELESPQELLEALLLQAKTDGMAVDKLCAEMVKQTGVSWNKRFKKNYGPINKFLKKYSERFQYNAQTNWVSLVDKVSTQKAHLQREAHPSKAAAEEPAAERTPTNRAGKRSPSPPPEVGHCWYDFDDSRVHPIRQQDIESQFSGKQSAYMLFYRQKAMYRPQEALGNAFYGVPPELIDQVLNQNEQLKLLREEYEEKINRLELQIHFASSYEFRDGALHLKPDMLQFMELVTDRRKTVQDLKTAISELGGEMTLADPVLHIARDLPAGLHLYNCIDDAEDQPLMLTYITNNAKLFVWDGKKVGGMEINVGKDFEPLQLVIMYANGSQLIRGFACCMTLKEVKVIVSNVTQIPLADLELSRVKSDGMEANVVKMMEGQEDLSLTALRLKDGDSFIAEHRRDSGSASPGVSTVPCLPQMSFMVEDRCQKSADGIWRLSVVTVENDIANVGELKAHILSQLALSDVAEGGRLRVDDDDRGLRPPLHEEQTLIGAALKAGQKLVIEPGPAPKSHQMTLTFSHDASTDPSEVMVDGSMTVQQCLVQMLSTVGLPGTGYHLRRTNWCGEATNVLDDLAVTLLDCQLRDGDHLLLQPGELPPKGFLKLPIFLPVPADDESVSLNDDVENLKIQENSSRKNPKNMKPVGEIIISKKATLEELILQILTLPPMEGVSVMTPQCIRVRLIESGRLATVLRGSTQTLQRLKVVAGSQLAIQILSQEEDLNFKFMIGDPYPTIMGELTNQILLNLKQRVVETGTYFPAEEYIWDHSNGCSASNLRSAIAQHMDIPASSLVIAKHFPQRYVWMVLDDSHCKKPAKQSKNSKKKGHGKANLKQAPFLLADGDDIGVKDTIYDPHGTDNFFTAEDDLGQERLKAEEEAKRKQREEARSRNAAFGVLGGGDGTQRRAEVGIKIHVGDFR